MPVSSAQTLAARVLGLRAYDCAGRFRVVGFREVGPAAATF